MNIPVGHTLPPEPLVASVELSLACRVQEKVYLLEHVCRINMMLREKRERGIDTRRDDREREKETEKEIEIER